jgi:hypothetical protein
VGILRGRLIGRVQLPLPTLDFCFLFAKLNLSQFRDKENEMDNKNNTGNYNTGYYNTGDYNTGYSNTGHYNTGHYNTGDYNTGFFCTETPKAILFDQPSDLTHDQVRELLPYIELSISCQWVDQSKMTHQEKKDNPNWAAMGGYLKKINKSIQETFPIWWESTTQENRDKFLNLPNFDAEKFLKCTGVDVRKKEVAEDSVIDRIAKLQKEIEELKNHLRNS